MRKTSRLRIFIVAFLLLAIPFAVYLVLVPTGFLKRAFGVKANLYIDAGSSFDVGGGVWKNLAQGGEERGRMLGNITTEIKALQPGMIRIDHVFDSYNLISKDGSGNLSFNWTELDATINDITSAGAKPFISLSYMPPAIAKNGDIVEVPNNWSDWELVVQKMIEHVSGKGALNINGVYYEVWNEPDLFGKFKIGGEKSYAELYLHTLVGASRASGVNAYKIGGPATTQLYEGWVKGLLDYVGKNGLRLDFYSWHRYSKDLSSYEDDWQKIRTWLNNYPNFVNVELIISESGINSENDKGYDGGFAAIQTIAVSALLENDVSKVFTFEIKDGPGGEKYWGRWGILTHEKFGPPEAKPRYRALQFLNSMRGFKVNVAGEGSWVKAFAKDDGKTLRVLVVNYDPAGSHYEAVPITFANLPYNNFVFRRTDFSGAKKEITVATDTNIWSTTEGFDANSAAILEISPI